MRARVFLLAGLLLAVSLTLNAPHAFAAATWYQSPRAIFTTGEIVYADSPSSLATGTGATTDSAVFVAAPDACHDSLVATPLTYIRLAANIGVLQRTAAGAEIHIVTCSIPEWLQRTTAARGMSITSLDLVYDISVVALTTNVWGKLASVTYANAVAAVVSADLSTPPTLATATQATPYVLNIPVAVPAYSLAAKVNMTFEFTPTMANTGVLSLYGFSVNFSRRDF